MSQDLLRGLPAFGVHPLDSETPLEGSREIGRLRRSRQRRGIDEEVGYMTLVGGSDGILRWQTGMGPAPNRRGPRMRAGRAERIEGEVIAQFKFEDLPPNKIGERLLQLDGHLTPDQGLKTVTPRLEVGNPATPMGKGRILLLIHGTFSRCEHMLTDLAGSTAGRKLLERAVNGPVYDQVIAFDHPTLSVSPVLNAATLARLFRQSNATVDIVCHSRGGLVARWWREVLDRADRVPGQTIFVGSPLAGTGFAAPARLQCALNALTNLSATLETYANATGVMCPAALPLGRAAAVLFSLFGKLTAIAARTPIVDAGVAMIPGLAAQSREGANGELITLRKGFDDLRAAERKSRFLENYYFAASNFEPADDGWRFWRNLRKKAADWAADQVFEGDNDLVVDTTSMGDLSDRFGLKQASVNHVERFGGTSEQVHHLNYFRQPETAQFIGRVLPLT